MKLLLVEDEQDLALLVKSALEGEAHLVDWLGDGQQAWEVLQVQSYDLLIVDWMLPGLSGEAIAAVWMVFLSFSPSLRQWRGAGG